MYHGSDTGLFGLLELPFLLTAVVFAFLVAGKLVLAITWPLSAHSFQRIYRAASGG